MNIFRFRVIWPWKRFSLQLGGFWEIDTPNSRLSMTWDIPFLTVLHAYFSGKENLSCDLTRFSSYSTSKFEKKSFFLIFCVFGTLFSEHLDHWGTKVEFNLKTFASSLLKCRIEMWFNVVFNLFEVKNHRKPIFTFFSVARYGFRQAFFA